MKKKHLACLVAGAMAFPAMAQQSSPSVEKIKEGGVTMMVFAGALGGTIDAVSANGRYMTGSFGETSGFVYDADRDSVFFLLDGDPVSVSNTGLVLGNFIPEELRDSAVDMNDTKAGLYQDGRWRPLEEIPDYPGKITAYDLSDDGKVAAGYGYVSHPNGRATYCGLIFDDTVIRKQFLHPAFPYPGDEDPSFSGSGYEGWGARMNSLSGDGKLAVGFGTKPPVGDVSAVQRTPHVWDVSGPEAQAFFLGEMEGDKSRYSGEVSDANFDGSVLVGAYGSQGTIWTRTESGWDASYIDPIPGYTGSSLTGISENGIIVGYASLDMTTRAPIIYTENTGWVKMDEYLEELYGFVQSSYNLYTPMCISADGTRIVGWGFLGSSRYSWCIQLDSMVLSRPLKAKAEQIAETFSVAVTWDAPMNCGKEVLGYDVYRNGEKVNEDLLSDFEFMDTEVPEGENVYAVKAVYAEGESGFSDTYRILVLRPGGCMPVQRIAQRTTYNRDVAVYWGIPSLEITQEKASLSKGVAESDAKYHPSEGRMLEYVSELDLLSVTSYGLAFYKGYYYVSDWKLPQLTKLERDGTFVSYVSIQDLPQVREMTVVGDSALWMVCGNRIAYQVDPDAKSIVKQLRFDIEVEHISWIPELDNGQGGFEIGNFEESLYVDKDGKKLSEGLSVKNISATEYYGGKLYASVQDGKNHAQVYVFDAMSRQQLGIVTEVAEIPEVLDMEVPACASAGLEIVTLPDSTVCVAYVAQLGGMTSNKAFLLEIESMPRLTGYNLYKNGQKVNEEPLKSRVYTEVIEDPGTYRYWVTAQFGDCESDVSDTVSVVIYDKGICKPVRNLVAEEINGEVFLEYEAPEEGSTGSLVGLNIYRNGERINEEFIPYLYYVDTTVESVGAYKYVVEAFYNNSCQAFDTVDIEVTHEGSAMPVMDLDAVAVPAASGDESMADVQVTWSLPWFESPYPLRWGEPYISQVIGIPGYTEYTLAVGWDSAWVNKYRDFKVAGIEFFLYGDVESVKPMVLVNEELVLQEECTDYEKNDFTTYMFSKPVALTDAWEFMVGYTLEVEDGATVIGLSSGEVDYGYGNWISLQPEEPSSWQVLNVENNFAIAALLVRERELADGSKSYEFRTVPMTSDGILSAESAICFDIQLSKRPMKERKVSDKVSLEGFNVYRDGEKLNESLCADLSFRDFDRPRQGLYDYSVGAVYGDGNEVMSDEVVVVDMAAVSVAQDVLLSTFAVWPNPAADYVNVEGTFRELVVYDVFGHEKYRKRFDSVNRNHEILKIDDWSEGLYVLLMVSEAGQVDVRKLVVSH